MRATRMFIPAQWAEWLRSTVRTRSSPRCNRKRPRDRRMNKGRRLRRSPKTEKLDVRSPFFVMSSEVETSLITAQTGSKRFLDFARNDKKVLHGIGSY